MSLHDQQQAYPDQQPPYGGHQGYPAPPQPPPPAKTSGLAITGLVLAFLLPGIGLILSVIAIFKTGPGKAKGRGLAIAGTIISIIVSGVLTVLLVSLMNAVSNSRALDKGCLTATLVINKASTEPSTYKKTADDLRAAAVKAEHGEVRGAITYLATDYDQLAEDYEKLRKAAKTGDIPDIDTHTMLLHAEDLTRMCTS